MNILLCFYSLIVLLYQFWLSSANSDDCWDEQTLQKIAGPNYAGERIGSSENSLNKFTALVKCLADQSKSSGGRNNNWQQWSDVAKGQFVPRWKSKQALSSSGPSWQKDTPEGPNGLETWPSIQIQRGSHLQPEPGVHPDDWGRVSLKSQGLDSTWTRRGEPAAPPPGWSSNSGNKEHRPLEGEGNMPQKNYRERQPQWTPDIRDPIVSHEKDFVKVTNEGNLALSLSRKYGYAILALSVVVLAVLMVATIFCCNSSNSTMSQPATQQTAPYDTYSIYSYKGGNHGFNGGGMDTIRSTGTIGALSLHTETMKSNRSMASPQYRVSDIDPTFSRRFEKDSTNY